MLSTETPDLRIKMFKVWEPRNWKLDQTSVRSVRCEKKRSERVNLCTAQLACLLTAHLKLVHCLAANLRFLNLTCCYKCFMFQIYLFHTNTERQWACCFLLVKSLLLLLFTQFVILAVSNKSWLFSRRRFHDYRLESEGKTIIRCKKNETTLCFLLEHFSSSSSMSSSASSSLSSLPSLLLRWSTDFHNFTLVMIIEICWLHQVTKLATIHLWSAF